MIDWLTIRVVSAYEVRAGLVQSIGPDGELEWQSPKRLSVEGSHSASITLRSTPLFPPLEISGNPAKFLQGHNLWPDSLPELEQATITLSLERVVDLMEARTELSGAADGQSEGVMPRLSSVTKLIVERASFDTDARSCTEQPMISR